MGWYQRRVHGDFSADAPLSPVTDAPGSSPISKRSRGVRLLAWLFSDATQHELWQERSAIASPARLQLGLRCHLSTEPKPASLARSVLFAHDIRWLGPARLWGLSCFSKCPASSDQPRWIHLQCCGH